MYLGNHKLVSLTSVPKNIMEQIPLEDIAKHIKNEEVIQTASMALPREGCA